MSDFLLQEDGSSHYLLEDGSGAYLKENSRFPLSISGTSTLSSTPRELHRFSLTLAGSSSLAGTITEYPPTSFKRILGSSIIGGTTGTVTLATNMTPGDSIVVGTKGGAGTGTVSSVTDSKGNSYVQELHDESVTNVSFWTCKTPATPLVSGDIITTHWTDNENGFGSVMVCLEYTHLGTRDKTGTQGNSGSVTSGSVTASGTTTSTSEVAIVIEATSNQLVQSSTSPFVKRTDGPSSGHNLHVFDRDLDSLSTPSCSWSNDNGDTSNYIALLATFPVLFPSFLTLSGNSSLVATLRELRRLTVTLAGTSSLGNTSRELHRITVTLAGTSSLSATPREIHRISLTLSGTSSLSASVSEQHRISLSLSGTSSLSSAISELHSISLTLAGTSSLSATVTVSGAVVDPIALTLAGVGHLTATLSGVHRNFLLDLAGTSSLRIFSIFDSNAVGVGRGNGGEIFGVRLAPNGVTETATLDGEIGSSDSTLHLTGDSSFPSTKPFVVTIDSEVLYVLPRGGGVYSVRGRGLSNTIAATHVDGTSVVWNDSYDMAIVSSNDIAHGFTASINSTPSFTYPGWLICFDSSQAYLGPDKYPFHVTSVLGVFDAGAGSGGTNRCDAAQPNAVATPTGVSNACPAALSNPSRIANDIVSGDVALVQYTNPEAVVLDLGPRSASLQSWFGLMRVNATNVDVTFTDPTGYVVDTIPPAEFTASINGVWGNPIPLLTGIDAAASDADPADAPIFTSHPVPWTTVTLPGVDRYFTYGPPHYSDTGWPMCCLAVRQNTRRVPYWASWDWHDYNFVYTGFGPDYTYAQLLVNRNGISFSDVPDVALPGSQDIDGPDVEWDDPTYFVAASWYVVLFNGPYLVSGPGIGGEPSPAPGGFVPGVTFPDGGTPSPPIITIPTIEGGSGGGISPPTGVGIRARIRWPASLKNDPESAPVPAPPPIPPSPPPTGDTVVFEGTSSLEIVTSISGAGTAIITTTLHGSAGFLSPGQVRPITLALHGS